MSVLCERAHYVAYVDIFERILIKYHEASKV